MVLEFESVEAARAWYESAAYQQAKSLRQAAADTNAVGSPTTVSAGHG